MYVLSVLILYINCYSVNLATSVMNIFTVAKLVAIFIVILGGAWKLFQGLYSLHLYQVSPSIDGCSVLFLGQSMV